ncbi:MAG: ROK family transcriptional regulator [Acidobacteriota bacterium]
MKLPKSKALRMVGVRDVRDANQTVFLHLIRERQPISRAEIVRATGLSAGTVSAIVNRLISENLVFEGTEGPSSGGRRPTYLQVNAETAYVIALDIGVKDSVYAISDFNGRILRQGQLATEGRPEVLLDSIAERVNWLVRHHYPRSRFAAVGVSIPGLIDRAEGELIVSPNLGWEGVPIREHLEKRLQLPIYVENDANAAAFAELWYGPLDEVSVRTLLFILVVEGIGSGLIINGELHVGSRVGLGGFGHMTLDRDGPRCSCGRLGCWEALASDPATLANYRSLKRRTDPVARRVSEVIALARDSNSAAREALRRTAHYLGEGIASLAHGLSPETIVVGGEIAAAWPMIEPYLKGRVKSSYLIPSVSVPAIRPASVQRPSLYGAIPIALQHYFRPESKLVLARF